MHDAETEREDEQGGPEDMVSGEEFKHLLHDKLRTFGATLSGREAEIFGERLVAVAWADGRITEPEPLDIPKPAMSTAKRSNRSASRSRSLASHAQPI